MVDIEIKTAGRGENGYLQAKGHAGAVREGFDPVCCAVTAIIDALHANLRACWDIRVKRSTESGEVRLTWNKSDRRGVGIARSNQAAGFAYTALKALMAQYPDAVCVRWKRRETT